MQFSSLASLAALLQVGSALTPFTNTTTPIKTTTKPTTLPTGTAISTTTTTEVSTTTIVGTFVTVCPGPEVIDLGNGQKTTITAAGTYTIKDCPCTLKRHPKQPKPTTVTEIVSTVVEYCPQPTVLTYGSKPLTVTAPGTVTYTDCPCKQPQTVLPAQPTSPSSPVQPAPQAPAPMAPAPAPQGPAAPGSSCPAAQTVTVTVYPAGTPAPQPGQGAPQPGQGQPGQGQPGQGQPGQGQPGQGQPGQGTPFPNNTKVCPIDLAGKDYQFPHLIVTSDNKTQTFSQTLYSPVIKPGVASTFNFDIPQSYAGKTCDVVFALPTQAQLETSSFTLSGSGSLRFSSRSTPAVAGGSTSGRSAVVGSWSPVPGNAFTVSSGACDAGKTISYGISTGSVDLTYFQDYNPCPIGLYVVAH